MLVSFLEVRLVASSSVLSFDGTATRPLLLVTGDFLSFTIASSGASLLCTAQTLLSWRETGVWKHVSLHRAWEPAANAALWSLPKICLGAVYYNTLTTRHMFPALVPSQGIHDHHSTEHS